MLLRQEFTNAGTQNGAAIATATIRGLPATLELHFPAPTVENGFEYRNGTTVSVAVAGLKRALLGVFVAVDGKRVARGPAQFSHRLRYKREVAGEHPDKVVGLGQAVGKAQFAEQILTVGNVFRGFDGRGPDRHIMPRKDLPWPMVNTIRRGVRIRGKMIHQRIIGHRCKFFEVGHLENGFSRQRLFHLCLS